jgi:hypothetical protein
MELHDTPATGSSIKYLIFSVENASTCMCIWQ